MADAADDLYSLRNAFWVGNYEEALQEAAAIKAKTPAVTLERDIFLHRSHIGLKDYKRVLSGIPDSAPPALLAVRLLALYFSSPSKRASALAGVEAALADAAGMTHPTVGLMAGTILLNEGSLGPALKAVRAGSSIEQ